MVGHALAGVAGLSTARSEMVSALPSQQVRILPDPFRRGAGCVVLFLGVVTMEKDRLPTVILLIFCVLAIILAEGLVCLLGGDL